MSFTAKQINDALIARSSDCIWASELDFFSGRRRIDFWTLEPIKSRGFVATSFEIKISRNDFRRDSDEKQSGALAFSDRFYYVSPPGVIQRSDVPAWAGLMIWNGDLFETVKRAPARQKQDPTWEFIVSIMRNCGQSRRDVGLLKAQLAYFEHQRKLQADMDRMASRFSIQRWQEALQTEDAA